MLAAGSTIRGEITTARAPPAAKGRRKLQAFCAEGEIIGGNWAEEESKDQIR